MLFTELNTNVLLYIYGCLDPIDSINLAQTCTRLRDVAQLHYKRYKIFNLGHFLYNEMCEWNQDRHNRIDATTVLKHIGPFIHVLEADLSLKGIGSDVRTSITKYCVNVKTLNVYEAFSSIPFTAYFDWLRRLHLTKISLSIQHLFLIDLPEITTLEELYVQYSDRLSLDIAYCVPNILERNVNINCLRISLMDHVKYEIFEKLKCLKRLVLDIKYDESGGQLQKVAANLKMTTLEKIELNFSTQCGVDGLNEFLQNLSENALHLKHLSIANDCYYCEVLDAYPLLSLHLLNLTSLRWIDKYPNLYKEIPKMQPNLTHLDLMIYERSDLDLTTYIGGTLPKPIEQIVFLIKNLEKLELLHIRFLRHTSPSSTLIDFLKESVLGRIFDCHSINRPTVTVRLLVEGKGKFTYLRFRRVKLDFRARKWTLTNMVGSPYNDFVGHKSLLPFHESYEETIDDLLAVQSFSGSASDLNAVKDEAIKWIYKSIGQF